MGKTPIAFFLSLSSYHFNSDEGTVAVSIWQRRVSYTPTFAGGSKREKPGNREALEIPKRWSIGKEPQNAVYELLRSLLNCIYIDHITNRLPKTLKMELRQATTQVPDLPLGGTHMGQIALQKSGKQNWH